MKALQLKKLCNEKLGHYFKVTVQGQKAFTIICDSEQFDFTGNCAPVIQQAFDLALVSFGFGDDYTLAYGQLDSGLFVATLVKKVEKWFYSYDFISMKDIKAERVIVYGTKADVRAWCHEYGHKGNFINYVLIGQHDSIKQRSVSSFGCLTVVSA